MSVTSLVRFPRTQRVPEAMGTKIGFSIAEKTALAFFLYITAAALVFHLATRDLCLVLTLNAVTFATLLALRRNRQRATWLAPAANLFPALLLLVTYRESGLLITPGGAHHLDYVFIQWDRLLLYNRLIAAVLQAGTPWLQHYLELAYLLCYPLVPLGALAIHFATRAEQTGDDAARSVKAMDAFWATVLPATLFCYAAYPFFPLTPPRVLFGDVPGPHVEPLLRQWNFWLLDHYSVQACIFPSGHVAALTAVALAVRRQTPRFGPLFLFLAGSVALATVYGRYHYAPDAVAGALVGFAAFYLSKISR